MDILNWLRIKKQQLIRTTLDSPQDLVVLGADVSFEKRGDKYQSYAMPAEDFLALARPYKVYTALMTQGGTNPPVATVLENTLGGNITWSYNDVGFYSATLTGAFLLNKTTSTISVTNGDTSLCIVRVNDNQVDLTSRDFSNVPGNGIINNCTLEIRVYN